MNTNITPHSGNIKRNTLIVIGVIVVIAAIVGTFLVGYSKGWNSSVKTADDLSEQDSQSTSNETVTSTANTPISNTSASQEVTFKDHVLTDSVAGYTATLPETIADVRVLTSSGPKITYKRSSNNTTLRYVEMTGSAQDYTAIIKLGVAKKGASFSVDWLDAGNFPGNLTDRGKTETSTLMLSGQKVTKSVYKTTDDRIIYVTYEASNNDYTLSASLFNPGLIGQSFVSEFDKTITSVQFVK